MSSTSRNSQDEILPWDFCFLSSYRPRYETQTEPYSVNVTVPEENIFFFTNLFIPSLEKYIRVAFFVSEEEGVQLNHTTFEFLQNHHVSLPYDVNVGTRNVLPMSLLDCQVHYTKMYQSEQLDKTVTLKGPIVLNGDAGFKHLSKSETVEFTPNKNKSRFQRKKTRCKESL